MTRRRMPDEWGEGLDPGDVFHKARRVADYHRRDERPLRGRRNTSGCLTTRPISARAREKRRELALRRKPSKDESGRGTFP